MFEIRPLRRNFEAAVRDLSSPKNHVRREALRDLSFYESSAQNDQRKQIYALLDEALFDAAPEVRAEACVCLADHPPQNLELISAVVEKISRLIEDKDVRVAEIALRSLGELLSQSKDEDSGTKSIFGLNRIAKCLRDRRVQVRYQAILAYVKIEPDANQRVIALCFAFEDEDIDIQYVAIRCAEESSPSHEDKLVYYARIKNFLPTLFQSAEVSIRLAAALLVFHLGQNMEDDYALTAKKMVRELVLTGKLDGQKPMEEDVAHAIEWAGKLQMKGLIPVLEKRVYGRGLNALRLALGYRHFAFYGRIALASMDHEKAVGDIIRDLQSSDSKKVNAAIVSAGRAKLSQAKALIEWLYEKVKKDDQRWQKGEVDQGLCEEALRNLNAL